jgi:predicted Co/Zn/Cd cation transporter (cation efflux family)
MKSFYESIWYSVLSVIAFIVIIVAQVTNEYGIINHTTVIIIDGVICLILVPMYIHYLWLTWKNKKIKNLNGKAF